MSDIICSLDPNLRTPPQFFSGSAPVYIANIYKHRSNLVTGGIAFRFYSPGGSSNFQLHVLAEGSISKSPLLLGAGVRHPHLIQNVSLELTGPYKCTCQIASKSVKRFEPGRPSSVEQVVP